MFKKLVSLWALLILSLTTLLSGCSADTDSDSGHRAVHRHTCKYDQEIQRRTQFNKRPKIDVSNVPAADPRVEQKLRGVSEERINEHLKKLTGEVAVSVTKENKSGKITSRSSYSKEIYELGMPYLEDQYAAMHIKNYWDAYKVRGKTYYNLVAELPGSDPSKILICGAHLDATAGEPWGYEPKTPGADDDASGTVLLLELARALKDQPHKYTILLVHFTNEEQGLEGSYAHSEKVKRAGKNLVGMLQFDMVGYHAVSNNRMDVHDSEDQNGSHYLTEAMTRACAQYGLNLTVFDTHNKEMSDRSDHAGYLERGYRAVLVSEEFTDEAFNPNYHSLKDTRDKLNMSYYMEIIKLAIATAANLSELQ